MERNVFELVSAPFIARKEPVPPHIDHSKQRDIYRTLLRGIKEQVSSFTEDNHVVEVISIIERLIYNGMLQNPENIRVSWISGHEVSNHIGKLHTRLENIPKREQLSLVIAQLAAVVVETSYAINEDVQLAGLRHFMALQSEVASYSSWKTLLTFQYGVGGPVEEVAQRFELERRHLTAEIEQQLVAANERLVDLQRQERELQDAVSTQKALAAGLAEEIKSTTAQGNKEIAEVNEAAQRALAIVQATKENFEAFKAAVIEEVRGKETRQLWKERDVENWEAFKVSAIVLAALLMAIPILGLICLDWVIATLRHIGDAAVAGIPNDATGTQLAVAAISRLVVITFPLVLYLWVIRLVVRFNSRSLLLHDDARQRQTMMDTYLLLVERNAATPEERGLVLNALFRPAPGHGSENVDPPKFTDLLPNVPKPS